MIWVGTWLNTIFFAVRMIFTFPDTSVILMDTCLSSTVTLLSYVTSSDEAYSLR